MSLIQLNRIRSGFWIWGIVGENVVNRDLLYLSGDETWMLSDASAAATMPARGVAMDTANAGETIGILLVGTIYGANWTWTPGAALYASATVAGDFTETAPVAPNLAQRVGEAYRANLVIFDPDSTDEAAAAALIYARERPAASQGPRNTLNFIEGANVTITVADNVPNAEIDVTVASAAGVDGNCVWWIEAPNPDTYHGAYAGQNLADGVEMNVRMTSPVPSNFASVVSADVIVISDSSGDMVWNCTAEFHEWCSDEDYNVHNAEFGQNQTSAIVADKTECLNIAALLANIATDDILGLRFRRYGADGSDTVDDAVRLLGVIIVVCSA